MSARYVLFAATTGAEDSQGYSGLPGITQDSKAQTAKGNNSEEEDAGCSSELLDCPPIDDFLPDNSTAGAGRHGRSMAVQQGLPESLPNGQQVASVEVSALPSDPCSDGKWTCVCTSAAGPYEIRTIEVHAAQHWANTGLYLTRNQTVAVTITAGTW